MAMSEEAVSEEALKEFAAFRTLEDVLIYSLKKWQAAANVNKGKEVPLSGAARDIYSTAFFTGAGAVFGLVEANGVSLTAIAAMLELNRQRRISQQGTA